MCYLSLKNSKGVALITALLMVTISMALILSVLYFITRASTASSLSRQYHTAHDAAYGGTEFFTKEILPRAISGIDVTLAANNPYVGADGVKLLTYNVNDACLQSKLLTATANWSGGCSNQSLDLQNSSDLQISLQGTTSKSNFNVFVKIVDSTVGNSSLSGIVLDSGGGVASSSAGTVTPVSIPYTYRIEILAQRAVNPSERTSLSGLYVY